MPGCNLGLDVTIWDSGLDVRHFGMIFGKWKRVTTNPATRPFGEGAGSGLDVKRGYTNRNVEDWIMWNELGISGGTAIVILIALYFVIKWAVKNGIKEAYSAITGKKTDEDIQNEKELKELGLDSEDQ